MAQRGKTVGSLLTEVDARSLFIIPVPGKASAAQDRVGQGAKCAAVAKVPVSKSGQGSAKVDYA